MGLGHARLSILDLSDAGLQPMTDPSGRFTVVHNGEIYNYLELRSELGGSAAFRTGTDTEVLLAAYARWGDACVERFVGMFAFALWDAERERLFCARDRLGIKPFQYAWHPDGSFLFASEVRALFAAGLEAVSDLDRWACYLTHGVYDHDRHTFFDGVLNLEPGHTLVLECGTRADALAGAMKVGRYWSLPERASEPYRGDFDDAAEELRSLLDDAVRLRMRSDVPVGVNLSGGLDSACLMNTVDALVGEGARVETFTAAFDDPAYDESGFAEAVPHRAAWVRTLDRIDVARCAELLDEVARHQSAPFGGVATIGYHALHGRARERGVTVLLEGQGVDEMLGGYAYYRPQLLLDLVEQGRAVDAEAAARAFGLDVRSAVDQARREAAGDAAPRYQDGSLPVRPDCLDPELVARAPEPPTFERPFPDHLRNALYRDLAHTKLPRVLRMNDRLSMAFGRELREPYLDHRIVELLFRIPAEWKLAEGVHKRLLRHAFRDRLPATLVQTPKRAVVTPQREWLRGPLAPLVRDALESASFRQRGWVRPERALQEFERFLHSGSDNTFFIWQWIMVAREDRFR